MSRVQQFAKNLNHFRLVTFDITDTLLKFSISPAEQYAKTAEEMGIAKLQPTAITNCFRAKYKEMAKLYPNFGQGTLAAGWEQWWTLLVEQVFACVDANITPEQRRQLAYTLLQMYKTRECWTKVPGAGDILHKMRCAGKQLGVISNFDPRLHDVLQDVSLYKNFDFVLTSYEAGAQKPNAKIFEIAMQRYQLKAQDCLHIGNIYDVDYVGARNTGWSSLLICNENTQKSKLANATHGYTSLIEMINALETQDVQW